MVRTSIAALEALEAARFVLSEFARLQSLSAEEHMDRIRADRREAFGELWGHPQWNPLLCGRTAMCRFEDVIGFARQKHADVGRAACWDTLSKAVVYAFVDRFIVKRVELTNASFNSMIDAACKHIRRKLEDHILVVPCKLWRQGEQRPIPIGPVEFAPAEQFFADKAICLLQPGTPADTVKEEAAAFANESGWVAIVRVPHVDVEIAEQRANDAIDAAINVLRMLLGPERTRRCRRAESWGPPPKHSYFRLKADGTLDVRFTWGGDDDLMWENWAEFVFGEQADYVRTLAGAALHGLTEPARCFPLQQRFLDALKWYGDAIAEHSLGARITKTVFAWERLVMTGDHMPDDKKLTCLVTERTACLCEHAVGERGPSLRKVIRELYEVRSRLAHGSQSPWHRETLDHFGVVSEDVTRRALIGSLRHYLALGHGSGSDDDLEVSFKEADGSARSGI